MIITLLENTYYHLKLKRWNHQHKMIRARKISGAKKIKISKKNRFSKSAFLLGLHENTCLSLIKIYNWFDT